ncbi:MAG: hypothetical protein A2Y74_01305 [Actinobacteria bacterium RBG_13_63_9]|nr:MAG: hypothetical protein A2Y74_01305 [Actinobacteria bacterium RBG_13_63_9]
MMVDTPRTLRAVGAFLDLDLQPVIDLVADQRPFPPGHGVGGNRMRRQGAIRLAADEEWKKSLPQSGRALARLSWPLASKYGYDVLSNPC